MFITSNFESMSRSAEILTDLGLVLTAIAAISAVWGARLTKKVSDEKERVANFRVATLEQSTADAHRRTAELEIESTKAKLDLAKAEKEILLLKKKQAWRIATSRFENALKEKVKGKAEIFFQRESDEAKKFANSIFACLSVSGWQIDTPQAAPESPVKLPSEHAFFDVPSLATVCTILPTDGAITIQLPVDEVISNSASGGSVFPKEPYDGNTPASSIMRAFKLDEIAFHLGSGHLQWMPVQKGTIRIVVGGRF